MTREEKLQAIAERTHQIIDESAKAMHDNVQKALASGAFHLDDYEVDNWLPRIIFQALLQEESNQHTLRDKKDVRVSNNIYACI